MPTAVGPNTKGEENLVFGYDLGDTRNSYKGEPTTNLVTNGDFSNGTSGWGLQGSAANYSEVTTFQGRTVLRSKGLTNYNTSGYLNQVISVTTGQTYTVSFDYYIESGQLTYDPDTANNSNAFFTSPTGEWRTHTSTWTAASSTLVINLWGSDSAPGYWYITNIQCEQKSHATPFVNGTRSATAGLLDFKGNSTIDLTNASFDSNAQMTFDGTSDYASVGYSTAINTPNGATYEVMLYPQGGGEFLSRGKSDSGTDPDNPRFYLDNTGYLYFDWSTTGADTYAVTPGSVVTFNQWYHVVGVAQPGDQLRIYVNGEETSYSSVIRTVPSSVPNTEDPIIIGGVSWIPRYFDGKVAIVKLYNRALTASEIKANYNAVKGRFNI